MAQILPFEENLKTKQELIADMKQQRKIHVDLKHGNRGTNQFLVFYGFRHGAAISKFCSKKGDAIKLLQDVGFNKTNGAYFKAGINAWEDLSKGEFELPNANIDVAGMSASSTLFQKIYFGAPGTGKSHKIDYDLFKDKNGKDLGKGLSDIPESRKFRTIFHPDYDYAQFVGTYKPIVENNRGATDASKKQNAVSYSFVPQVFAKAYATAWNLWLRSKKKEEVFLVIEEINRGNCAQIFGDLFQLLDRADDKKYKGFSQYSIDADADLADWLKKYSVLNEPPSVWTEYEKLVGKGKLRLPPNLNILATMNTSDQSLFPMDSAFKRRFDWEYVPIKYKKAEGDTKWNADKFVIEINKDHKYSWLDFLEKVNGDILSITYSEDKQMGEFFVKPKDNNSGKVSITFEDFRSKVLFYLWDSVYKDEEGSDQKPKVFHFDINENADKKKKLTFQALFEKEDKDQQDLVIKIMKNLDVKQLKEPSKKAKK